MLQVEEKLSSISVIFLFVVFVWVLYRLQQQMFVGEEYFTLK